MSWISNLFKKKKVEPSPPKPWFNWEDRQAALDSLTEVQKAAIAATIDDFKTEHLVAFFGDVGLDHLRYKVLRPLSHLFGEDPRLAVTERVVSPQERERIRRLNEAVKFVFGEEPTERGAFRRRVTRSQAAYFKNGAK